MGKRVLHEETRIVTTFIVVDDDEANDIVGKVTVGPQANLPDDPCVLKRVNDITLKNYLAFLELAKAEIIKRSTPVGQDNIQMDVAEKETEVID